MRLTLLTVPDRLAGRCYFSHCFAGDGSMQAFCLRARWFRTRPRSTTDVPIGLVARDFREGVVYALLTHAALFSQHFLVPGLAPAAAATMATRILNITV